jgi:hypothetical protein
MHSLVSLSLSLSLSLFIGYFQDSERGKRDKDRLNDRCGSITAATSFLSLVAHRITPEQGIRIADFLPTGDATRLIGTHVDRVVKLKKGKQFTRENSVPPPVPRYPLAELSIASIVDYFASDVFVNIRA